MTLLRSFDDILPALCDGTSQQRIVHKFVPTALAGAQQLTSLWSVDGTPSLGATPASAFVPNQAVPGAVPLRPLPVGKQRWLLGATLGVAVGGVFGLYDRIFTSAGLNATLTSEQLIGAATLNRYDGVAQPAGGNRLYLEIYTAVGATPRTASITYIDQDGNQDTSGNVTIGGAGANEVGRLIEVPLAAGDTGVRSVVSVLLVGSTGTAGNFGVTIGRPLLTLHSTSYGTARDVVVGVPTPIELQPECCLAWWSMLPVAAASGFPFYAHLSIVDR